MVPLPPFCIYSWLCLPTLIDDGAVLPPGHQLVQVNAELAAALMPLLLPPRFVVGGRRQAGETLRFVFGSAMRCEPSLNKGGAASRVIGVLSIEMPHSAVADDGIDY